jgi:hypothetical protein
MAAGQEQGDKAIMRPMNLAYRALGFVLASLALPALGAWEELRRNDQVRLSIDTKSIKRKGDTVSFVYLVDFREPQGDYKTVVYRSLATKAHIRCKARTMVTEQSEAYPANEAKGPSLGVMKPMGKDAEFKKLEAGSSDEDLHKRVCSAATSNKAPPKK